MELTTESIQSLIDSKSSDLATFAQNAQKDVNTKQQSIQQAQAELQNLVKSYQKEVDKREGEITGLQALIAPVPDVPATSETPA